MNEFYDSDVWKEASIFRNDISALVKTFPAFEKYKLVDQIIRSSRSIGNNIAEGKIPLPGKYTILPASKRFVIRNVRSFNLRIG